MTRLRWSTAILALSCLLVAACGSDDDTDDVGGADDTSDSVPDDTDEDADDDAGDDSTDEPAGDDSSDEPAGDVATTVRSRFNADPANLDPIYIGNTAEYVNAFLSFEGLVQQDPDGEGLINVLAETYEVAEDGLSIDFTLRPGVQFHDDYGEVTADDVKFSLERAGGIIPSDPEPFAISFYTGLERVDVTDTYAGTIVLSEPSATLVEQAIPLTQIVSKAAFDELGPEGFQEKAIGTGPYVLDEFVPGEHIRYVNFEGYSGAQPYVPEQRFEEIVFQIITDDAAAELAYEAGDLDVLDSIRLASVSRFESFDNTTITSGTSRGYRWISMNVLDPALANEDLRRAISAAIDVPSIVEATSEGLETRATALLAPTAPIGYWADAPVQAQDLEEARRLVELVPEADRALRFTVSNDETSRTVAQIAQQNLQDVGLTVEIEVLDPATFFVADETVRDRQLSYVDFPADFREPSLGFLWFTCDQLDVWNYMYWCNEDYDALLRQAQQTVDPEARGELYIEMQRLMAEGLCCIWLSHPTEYIAARSDTVEVLADPAGTVFWQSLEPL